MTRLVTEVLARSLRNAWERIDALREELAQARSAVPAAEESAQYSDESYAKLSRDYAQLKDDLATARRNLAELERDLAAYRSARDELRSKLYDAQAENDRLSDRVDQLEDYLADARGVNERLSSEIAEARDALEYYKGLRDAAEAEVRRLRDELDDRTLLTEACRASRIERGVRALVDYAFTRATSAAADGDDDVYRAYDDMQLRLEDVLRLDDYTNPDAVIAKLTE